MLKKYQLSIAEMKKVLYNYCKKIGIKFLASVFDEKSLHLLKNFQKLIILKYHLLKLQIISY